MIHKSIAIPAPSPPQAAARPADSGLRNPAARARDDVHAHLRGSGVLFFGRLVSKWLNFAVQVLVVRVLSQADYGALAYVISLVVLLEQITSLGLDRSITRFVPMYQEQRRYDKLFGTVLMALGTVFLTALALAVAINAGSSLLRQWEVCDERVLALLLLLAFLMPVTAVDNLLLGLFAVLAHPGAIFFRRHVLAPGLKLLVVLVVAMAGWGVYFLAAGYLAAEIVGMVCGAAFLWSFLRRHELMAHFAWDTLRFPCREVLTFTIPLLSTELLVVVLPAIEVVLLGWFGDVEQVAIYRAVGPLVLMVDLVRQSFAPLFMPAAARMLARHDNAGIDRLYWQTTLWLAVLSFPVFVLTFCMARELTVLLFGARYAASASILALASLALYFEVSLGFNAMVLKVYGRLRYVLLVNAATLVTNVISACLLIPRWGALGAAIATCVAWTVHALLNQYGLWRATGIRGFRPQFLSIYLIIAGSATAILLIEQLWSPPLYVGLLLAAAASLLVLRWSGPTLQAGEVFPELARIPLLKRILGE